MLKIEQIARLRVSGMKDWRIAEMMGMSVPGLSRILALSAYKEAEEAVLANTLTKMDEALAGKADEIRKMYQVGVPVAMRALLDAAIQRRDVRASITAASEILDRDPDRTFPKTKGENQGDMPSTYNQEAVAAALKDADAVAARAAPLASQRVQ